MKKILFFLVIISTTICNASTITVTNTNNSGTGSLRQALSDANNGDTVNFSVTGVITVTSFLDISKDIVIEGPGADVLAIDGNNSTIVFRDQNYAINDVEISGLEIRNGSSGAYGAGISGLGYNLTVKYCNIHSNTLSAGYGAAVSVWSIGSSLTIENSSIHNNNSSGHGTCIYVQEGGDLNISNSTIYNNNGGFTGQAIYASGSDVTLTNVTIAGHTSGSSAIRIEDYEDFMTPSNNKAASISIVNCIIDNSINNYTFFSMMGGAENSLGYNISNDNTMSSLLTESSDLNNTSSLLDTLGLQDNGGTTPTIALQCGSPAIDGGTLILSTDQIDSDRQGNGPDIGAFESSLSSATGTDTQTACNDFTWIDGNTYSSNNNTATYNIEEGAANGCDSLVTLDLTINDISDITTSSNEDTIIANNSLATYTWLNCDNNYSIIVGETNQSFIAIENGNYAVELSENGCVDTSSCVTITTVGIIENNFDKEFLVYPNPTDGNFSINLGSTFETGEISIYDIHGKLILLKSFSQEQIFNLSLKKQPIGVYFLSIQTKDKKAVVRLIKN